MFTHPVSSNEAFWVGWHDYAERHYKKKFEKKYKGKLWQETEAAIKRDLARLGDIDNKLQFTQNIDELWYAEEKWVFKYDFRIFGTRVSARAAGNRLVGMLDARKRRVEVFLIYHKDDLPKNVGETEYIGRVFRELYGEL